jgi:hypothetical protein
METLTSAGQGPCRAGWTPGGTTPPVLAFARHGLSAAARMRPPPRPNSSVAGRAPAVGRVDLIVMTGQTAHDGRGRLGVTGPDCRALAPCRCTPADRRTPRQPTAKQGARGGMLRGCLVIAKPLPAQVRQPAPVVLMGDQAVPGLGAGQVGDSPFSRSAADACALDRPFSGGTSKRTTPRRQFHGSGGRPRSLPYLARRSAPADQLTRHLPPHIAAGTGNRHAKTLGIYLQPRYRRGQHVITQILQRLPGI